jgi:hypothetical protein
MVSALYFSRSQPFKYKMPRAKNSIVHITKIRSVMYGSWPAHQPTQTL